MSETPAAMTEMPWIRWLDLDTVLDGDGTLRVSLRRPKPEHLNHNGHVNAAVAYGVAEVAGAGATVAGLGAALARIYTVIDTGSITYRRPATGGITASALVDPDRTAQALTVLEGASGADIDVDVRLEDPNGRPTGNCRFRVALRPRRRTA